MDFLCSLPDWDGKNVIVTGGSQGGALTLVTAALNEKVTMCAPFYPALCDLQGFRHDRAGDGLSSSRSSMMMATSEFLTTRPPVRSAISMS